MSFVRAVALDLDGTVAEHDRVLPTAPDAIDAVRDDGVAVVLATGRILSELDGPVPPFRRWRPRSPGARSNPAGYSVLIIDMEACSIAPSSTTPPSSIPLRPCHR